MILNQRQTWAPGLLTSICFALLFWRYRPIAALEMHHHGEGVNASQEDLDSVLKVPRHAVQQAIVALVKNAVEASPAGSTVSLATSRSPESIRFEVKDSGSGMSQETLRHAGEPFFTTKEPGRGMGPGIFLVRTLADRLGGRLTFDSSPAKGTLAVLELPPRRTVSAEG